jgi:hypothetical protein
VKDVFLLELPESYLSYHCGRPCCRLLFLAPPHLILWSYDDLIALPNGSHPGGLFPVPGQVLLRGRSALVRPSLTFLDCHLILIV